MTDMATDGHGRVRLDYRVPARGLIGFQGEFMTPDARHRPHEPRLRRLRAGRRGEIAERRNGVLISMENGETVAYALWSLQERGRCSSRPARRSTTA